MVEGVYDDDKGNVCGRCRVGVDGLGCVWVM